MLGGLVAAIGVVLIIAALMDVRARRKGYRLRGRSAWAAMKEDRSKMRAVRSVNFRNRNTEWMSDSSSIDEESAK
jgi:hypothetical protein